VVLRVTLRADASEAARIRQAFPSAVVKGGTCEVLIEGEMPYEVADRARVLLETARGTSKPAADKRL
jgi:hypothetical protein